MSFPTYTILVDDTDAQALVDRLNRPRSPESGDAGLGGSTCPDDATELPGFGPAASPNAPIQSRWITLWVRPDFADRFESIIDDNPSAEAKRWHPEGKVDAAHPGNPPQHARAVDHPRGRGLERRGPPDDTGNGQGGPP